MTASTMASEETPEASPSDVKYARYPEVPRNSTSPFLAEWIKDTPQPPCTDCASSTGVFCKDHDVEFDAYLRVTHPDSAFMYISSHMLADSIPTLSDEVFCAARDKAVVYLTEELPLLRQQAKESQARKDLMQEAAQVLAGQKRRRDDDVSTDVSEKAPETQTQVPESS